MQSQTKTISRGYLNNNKDNDHTKPVDTQESTEAEKMVFGIHGGGNIGLGLMTEIISKSHVKYEIIATSNDNFIANIINNTNKYSLRHNTATNEHASTLIKNVRIISRESHDIIELYKTASIIAICLTPVVIPEAAKDIAKGIIARYRTTGNFLKILVLMNIPQCDLFTKEKIKHELHQLISSETEVNAILENIQIIPTVVDRIVTKINQESVKNQIKIQLQEKINSAILNKAQVDFILADTNRLSEAINTYNLEFYLFNAELNYMLYVPKYFTEATNFPTMKKISNIEQFEAIKNRYINGPHAILAWIGGLLGSKTIAEAIQIPGIERFIKSMMNEEIAPALMAEFPTLSKVELRFLRNLFIKRCFDSTDDLITRVGRDPMRKINANGRIRGTIELCNKHRLRITTKRLELGLAAAILYAIKKVDPSFNPGCAQLLDIYKKNNNNYKAVLCYNGDSPSGTYIGLDKDKDSVLINNILHFIHIFEKYHSELTLNLNNYHQKHRQISTVIYRSLTIKSMNLLPINHFNQQRGKLTLFINHRYKMNIQKIGILSDSNTGHLTYSNDFKPMRLSFELVFVRHGETYGNCGQATQKAKIDYSLVKSNKKNHTWRIFQGNVDSEINQLTDYGKMQAILSAKKLEDDLLKSGWQPDVIFYSPLSRAKETGIPFVERNGFTDRYLELSTIREMSFGTWDNRRVCDIEPDNDCHLFYNSQNALVKQSGINCDGQFSESENFIDVITRAYHALTELNSLYSGKKIIMFSHSMFGAACCILLGKGQKYENANYLAFDGKRSNGESYTIPNAIPYYLNISSTAQPLIKIRSFL